MSLSLPLNFARTLRLLSDVKGFGKLQGMVRHKVVKQLHELGSLSQTSAALLFYVLYLLVGRQVYSHSVPFSLHDVS